MAMQRAAMKAILGLALVAASSATAHSPDGLAFPQIPKEVKFPFKMSTEGRHVVNQNFMANCYNFAYDMAKGQTDAAAARVETAKRSRDLCEDGNEEHCNQWSDALSLAIEAKLSGKKVKDATYAHWCHTLFMTKSGRADEVETPDQNAAVEHEVRTSAKVISAPKVTSAHISDVAKAPKALASHEVKEAEASHPRSHIHVAHEAAEHKAEKKMQLKTHKAAHKVQEKAEIKVEKKAEHKAHKAEHKAEKKAEHQAQHKAHHGWADILKKEDDITAEKRAADRAAKEAVHKKMVEMMEAQEEHDWAQPHRYLEDEASFAQQQKAEAPKSKSFVQKVKDEGHYIVEEVESVASRIYNRL